MPAFAPLLILLAISWWPLTILPLLSTAATQSSALAVPRAGPVVPAGPASISLDGTPLNHLLLDARSGQLYVGAVNVLYHLSPDLQLLSQGRTGPKLDNPDCLPPIDPKDCTLARETDNTNKILLLEEGAGQQRSLIVCGTVLQGICEKRSLGNVSEVLYQTSNPVDTQYVAANDPRVSTVGVLVEQKGTRLMLVGRGYTSKGPGGIPPITTRRLAPSPHHSAPAFSHEELGKLVVGSYSEYNNHFITALHHKRHVYFLFYRRDVWGKKEYRTYVSRLCVEGDPSFYSYVEVPLTCGQSYNLAQAATLGSHRGAPALFIAMAAGQTSASTPTADSALCVYGMGQLDEALQRAQLLCYTQEGRGATSQEEAYIEYEVSSKCLRLPPTSVTDYPCGGEHTPSPIASAVPLEATPVLTRATLLSAVAATTEAGHTIALLGDKTGQLHKVTRPLFSTTGQSYTFTFFKIYGALAPSWFCRGVVSLLLPLQVSRLPVAECERRADCHSCLQVHDPYCGWCVLEGRCTRKMECSRHRQPHHWLWSYDRGQRCVSVQSLVPASQSRDNQTEVSLPALSGNESLSCSFGELPPRPAVVTASRISCQSPAPELLPSNPEGSDHMSLRVSLMFGSVTISHTNMTFYDCRASAPCVTSLKRCVTGCKNVFYGDEDAMTPHGVDSCPCVWGLQGSPLVPVGFDKELFLEGRNLDMFEVTDAKRTPDPMSGQLLCIRSLQSPRHELSCFVNCRELCKSTMFERSHVPVFTVKLYDCSVGQSDCSQCRAVSEEYRCVWCGGERPSCVYSDACAAGQEERCPPPLITKIDPDSGPLEGGIRVTVWGSNLGQRFEDVRTGVSVAGVSCLPLPEEYIISTRLKHAHSLGASCKSCPHRTAAVLHYFLEHDPQLIGIVPDKGPVSGGTLLTVQGSQLLTGLKRDLKAYVGLQPCYIVDEANDTQLVCRTSPINQTAELTVKVLFGKAERTVGSVAFRYLEDPVITDATPAESFYGGGRAISVSGKNLDVVQRPMMSMWVEPVGNYLVRRKRHQLVKNPHVPSPHAAPQAPFIFLHLFPRLQRQELCTNITYDKMTCLTPQVPPDSKVLDVWFELDNVRVDFESIKGKSFTYHPDPQLYKLNSDSPDQPYRFKPGGVIAVEGKGLTLAMTREEVVARLGNKKCEVKTLDSTHLYCEPPEEQPLSTDELEMPSLLVMMGKLEFDLGPVQYDSDILSSVPLAAQVGLAAGAAVVVLVVLVIILMYRRKSKQALRDYKKVLVQLETLEINVGDQCRKEFTDLMTEMMDLSSDVGGPGIPLLDYRTYAERIFFPGQRGAPLSQNLDLPDSRRQTVVQGLGQLNNLLNNRLFLIRFIHTLEAQQSFSQRDRGYVASLLTMALHDKLEYFTDVMKTLLGDLVQQYVAKNPKLMLRRTETVVEKMLTNWMSICLYSFLKEVAGEPLYMLYRAIKYQVDKGPVDAVTGKAKRTLNDSHLLREDIDYCSMTLNVLVKSGVEVQPFPVKVLDTDTITQVKDKILDQIYKGAPFSQRPSANSLDLEWRSGQAGHLTLSDDDVTAVVQGRWKKINTLQHYKVDCRFDSFCVCCVETPMLEVEEEEGLRLWHLVKSSEDPEIPKHRKSSMRERERAKAIPEIYLTRLLSMKGTLQKFVDDVFVAILSTKRPPPIAVRFFFDFLDDMAEKHGIDDPETVHIWKTNSLPLRFWVNILKNPQFVFDIQVTDSVDAVLSVIAQTFIDSCTTSEHKVGRDSPVNKLLYAREIPRYKELVERYYSDIHNAVSGCYQEMNSTLTELSGSFASEMNSLVALHELYKYINKYYDQVIMSLEEDPTGQKMQLAYRLQQVAALVENKVTDL
uniref:Plexin-B1 n=1 Tax=Denticeps clupeoides TaxID=299321 RepID=A0AAY4B393_9TELE